MSAPKKMKSHEKVLILGSGGREHALAWKMAQSDLVQEVYVAPGNAGTLDFGKVSNIDLDIRSFDDISDWCKSTKISLVIVGPEDPLAKGLADHLTSQGVPCFGPTAQAAQIEASKEFAKSFMVRHEIPTARYKSFTEVDEACEHIRTASYKALVVKASGLAAGKGVVVAESVEEACEAVKQILGSKKFGAAGETIVVEELLEGEEVSCLAFTDGTSIAIMPAAQDHKRLKEGDKGPNTGGMGAYCPYPKFTEEDLITIEHDILQKAVDGLREEDIHYVGVLYAGVMLTNEGPKVLEFNCRFGDPETQSILPLMESDLFVVTKACIEGTLAEHMPHFDKESKVLGIVVASGGYPNSYNTGYPITGIPQANATTLIVFHAGTTIRHHQLVTSGGRVLAVMAKEKDFETASEKAQKGAALIQFTDSFYRSDIGYRVLTSGMGQQPLAENSLKNGLSYKQAGVDIVAGNSLVELIKPLAKATRRSGCDATLGSFGAIFNLQQTNFSRNALLVSGTDGVGTKLKIAHAIGFHKSVGIDLVAMVVNDILAHGAEPLFFLDYFACGRLDVPQARDVIEGVAQGCSQAGCALVGGETAEMAGMYRSGEYDLAGFGVGAVEKDQLLPFMNQMKDGDVVLGLPSSGIHSNGFSLVRKIIEINDFTYGMPSPVSSGKTLGEELLTPTKIYVKSLLPLMQQNLLKGFAHITGGGLVENIPRILPKHLAVELDATSWNIPAIFGWIQHNGKVPAREMIRTYNCGLGGIIIVSQMNVLPVIEALIKSDDKVCIVGKVITKEDSESVMIKNLETCLQNSYRSPFFPTKKKKNVAVLISGSGTNLQALIDHTECPGNKSSAQIVLVISNKPNVQGLERAQKAGIRTLVIDHKLYKTREDFDDAIHKELVNANIDLVCLAGFMRILSGSFVNKWNGRILNVHPSLLPSFKGANAHKLVLESGVRISGCTVHFVAEEIDSGAILVQKSAPVLTFDTEETLSERVKKLEHVAYPLALELVASEKAVLQDNGKIFWKE